MQLNTNFNNPFGCPFSPDKVYVDPIGTTAEAVDFGHRHSETHHFTLNLAASLLLTRIFLLLA
jgi:hypothetical protein